MNFLQHETNRQKIQITLYLVWMISSILYMVFDYLWFQHDPFHFQSPAFMIFLCSIPPLSIYYLRHSQKQEDILASKPMSVNALYAFIGIGLILAIIIYAKILGIGTQLLQYEWRMATHQYIVSTISLSFIVSRIVANKSNFYIHELKIQLPRKAFYVYILKQIGFLLGSAIVILLLGMFYWVFIKQSMLFSLYYEHIKNLFAIIIIFLLEYLVLAIFERIHFAEHQTEQPNVLFSRNVILLMIVSAFISVCSSVVNQIQAYLHISSNPNWSVYLDFIDNQVVTSRLYYIDSYLLMIFTTILIFHSIKKRLPADHKRIKLWFVLHFVPFIIRFFFLIFNLMLIRLIYEMGPQNISELFQLVSYVNLFLVIYDVAILLFASVFLKKRHYSLYRFIILWIVFIVYSVISTMFLTANLDYLSRVGLTLFEFILRISILLILSKQLSIQLNVPQNAEITVS